jgi:protein-disulfide isomerase
MSIATIGVTLAVAYLMVWPMLAGRPAASEPAEEVAGDVRISMGRHLKGAETARIGIIEFSDFECLYCGRHARDVYPRISADLVETGIVVYSFRHLPLDAAHRIRP